MNEPRSAWRDFFEGWSGLKLLSFGLGLLLIVVTVGGLAWWTHRAPQAVLFSDLAERDAAVISAELDKLKQPYALSEDGKAILVAADQVHKTRMALMGKPLPLHGAVGFELFNNADFGVSDFVQKVNYQRALQGELTRTILSIEQVQDARVHLALPDSALFRKDGPRAKASVTLTLKGGHALQTAQVLGIQRLVAASVSEVRPEDVTVLDQNGVALSRAAGEDAEQSGAQLDARQSLESHLGRKVGKLLDQWLSPGESMVAVDVLLNHEQAKVTTEEVLGAPHPDRGNHPAGVLTRERSTSREAGGDAAGTGSGPQLLSQESEYQTGRRVSQVNSPAGRIARLNVAVVVKRALSDADMERARQLVATAVGLQPERGDVVSIQSLAAPWAAPATPAASAAALAGPAGADRPAQAARHGTEGPAALSVAWVLGGLLVLGLLALIALTLRGRRTASHPPADTGMNAGQPLDAADRQAMLKTLQQWLEPQP